MPSHRAEYDGIFDLQKGKQAHEDDNNDDDGDGGLRDSCVTTAQRPLEGDKQTARGALKPADWAQAGAPP